MQTGFFVLAIGALVACAPPDQTGYHGALYFGQGSYLLRYGLRDGSLSVVDNLGDKSIRDISEFGEDKLLIAETASINRRTVPRISWFDLKTGQSVALYSGVLAKYLAAPGVVVYDDGLKLYAVQQWGPGNDEIIFSHGSNQLSGMTVVSGDVLLFETIDAGRAVIYSWNADTGTLTRLDALSSACELRGAVWIDTLLRLTCRKRAATRADPAYILSDLDGAVDGKLDLPKEKRFFALTYIAGQDVVILRETWHAMFGTQERSAVWAYDIQSGESRRLSSNQNLGTSVVYTDF